MADSTHDTHAAQHSFWPYVFVGLALWAGTIITFTVARGEHTAWTLPIALAIASCKASLVIFFFMHLKGDRGMPKVIMLTIALTLVWFISIVLSDYRTRFALGVPTGADIHVPARTLSATPEAIER